MDKVVYITGAGFSAPLGLPVMSNFLLKAKDMYAVNSKKYAHFQEIFEQLDGMARIKHYFSSDLFNIEEILSVLEMERHVGKIDSAESFTRLIRDVIEYYTPELQVTEAEFAGNPEHYLFGETWRLYGYFVLGLLGKRLQVWRGGANEIVKAELVAVNEHHTQYSIVTLNYDCVLETVIDRAGEYDSSGIPERFRVYPGPETGMEGPDLCKLHGSIDSKTIVPPTWNKNLHLDIGPAWERAHQVLKEANQLRFLGYSLPESDAYIRYLLKSAIMRAPHLKQIDVLCLDDGTVAERYSDFIKFNFYRFSKASVEQYLDSVMSSIKASDSLERAHSMFWRS